MKITQNDIIRHISLITKCIGFFPVLLIISDLTHYTYDIKGFWGQILGLIIAGYLGYLQQTLKGRVESYFNQKPWMSYGVITLGYLISVGAVFWLVQIVPVEGILMQVCYLVLGIVCYVLFMQDYHKHYSMILSLELLVGVTGIYFTAFVLTHIQRLEMIYMLIIVMYLFVMNQAKVDRFLERTKQNTPMYQSIKKDNMKWYWMIGSILLVGYPLRKMIAEAVKWLGIKILMGILLGIKFIINLIPIQETTEVPMEGGTGGGILPGGEENIILEAVLWVIFLAIFFYFIYSRREEIKAGIIQLIHRCKAFINGIGRFLFGRKKLRTLGIQEYEEVVEELKNEEQVFNKQIKPLKKRRWQKQVRRYLRYYSADKSYREGYKLLLQGMTLTGIVIKEENTPREVMSEAHQKINELSIERVTHSYEQIRYAEEQVQEIDYVHLNNVLWEMLKFIK